MKKLINTFGLTSSFILASIASFGQTGNTIIVDVQAARDIEPAYRLTSNPKIIDTVFPTPTTNYPLLAINYEPSFEIQRIAPATVNVQQKLPQLYNGYAKIGIGSVLIPLAEVYYNNTRNRKLNYGIHLQHLSSFGNMPRYAPSNYNRTTTRAFVGVNERKYSWNAEAYYKNQGLHFYGFPNEGANADSIKQRFTTVGGKGEFNSHKHDSLGVNWRAGIEYRHFNDKKPLADSLDAWRGSENYVNVSGGAWFKWGNEIFAADADLKYNGFKYGVKDSLLGIQDTGFVTANTLFSLRPSITTYSKNQRLKAKIGVDITVSAREKTTINIYPNAEVKYSLFDNILIPYVGLRGGMKQATFKSFSDVNEFMLTNTRYKNENKAIEIYGGIKGTLAKRVGFNVSASFAHIKDKALFVTDTTFSGGNRFGVIYDTINIAQVEASLSYQLQEKTKIDVIGRYFSYSPINNTYAWNLPQLQFILRGSYNLYDKFIFTLDFDLETGRQALVYGPGDDVTVENNQYAKKLGVIADANLSVEYRYNKRISAFVNLNNVAAQRYKRWYNYPVQGFQVMAGVTFRF